MKFLSGLLSEELKGDWIMSTPTYKTGNTYFDQAAFVNFQKQVSRNSSTTGHLEGIAEEAALAEVYETGQTTLRKAEEFEANHGLDDLRRDYSNLDEFTGWNPNALEHESTSYFENDRRRRKQQDINSKKSRRAFSFDDIEESVVERFFNFVDSVIKNFTEMADEAFAKINPFSNWINEKPRQIKMAPPPMAENPPMFLRESFKPKRSPHLWKSDPKPWWHLAFGNETNNKVVENLIKYQNDTITADA